MGLVGVLAFIFALLFSVMVHEFGHYITAKRYGMRVTEFFLGFGKRLWSTQRGETEFGIKEFQQVDIVESRECHHEKSYR